VEDEIEAQAEGILGQARQTAASLIEEAHRDVRDKLAQAKSAGHDDGFAEAEAMREEIAGLEQRMVKEVEGEIVRTALRVAEDLLAVELARRDDAIVDIALAALTVARDAREVFLRVHPSGTKALRAHHQRLLDALAVARALDVREDRKVKPGGVLVQTESGVVDAQLETQLAEIARVLGA